MCAGFIIDFGWRGSDGRVVNFATRLSSQKSIPMKKPMLMTVRSMGSIGSSSFV